MLNQQQNVNEFVQNWRKSRISAIVQCFIFLLRCNGQMVLWKGLTVAASRGTMPVCECGENCQYQISLRTLNLMWFYFILLYCDTARPTDWAADRSFRRRHCIQNLFMCVHENAHNDHILSLRNEICVPILGKWCGWVKTVGCANWCHNVCQCVMRTFPENLSRCNFVLVTNEITSVSQNTKKKIRRKICFRVPNSNGRYLIRAFNCCHSMQIIHKITFFFSENSAATSITIFHWAVFKRTLTNNQIFAHNFSDNTISKYKKQTPKQNILRRAVDFLCCLFSAPYRITQHPERY